MATSPKSKSAPFPSREQIVEFIRGSETRVGKREIARAFRLNAEQKVELRRVLKELESVGDIGRDRGRRFQDRALCRVWPSSKSLASTPTARRRRGRSAGPMARRR